MKDYDDLWADEWRINAEVVGPSEYHRLRLVEDLMKRYRLVGETILDAGCGSGNLLVRSKQKFEGASFTGLDVSSEALAVARQRVGSWATLQVGDLEKSESLPHEEYNVILCSEVLEYIIENRIALDNLYNLCKPGGQVVIAVPHGPQYWTPHDDAAGHCRRYTRDEMRDKSQDAGFVVSELFTWGFPMYSLYYRLILERVSPQAVWRQTGFTKRFSSFVLSALFYIDDLFKGSSHGRRLICLLQKP